MAPLGGKKIGDSTSGVQGTIGSLADTLSTACPPSQPIVEGLINRGDIVTVAARSGTGKTPLITQLSLCAGGGVPFLGRHTHRTRVALIDLESSPLSHRELLLKQAEALGLDVSTIEVDVFVSGNSADPNSRELDRVLSFTKDEDRFLWIEDLAIKGRYGLIVIDTALTFLPMKSADEAKVRQLFKWVRAIARTTPPVAILLVLHLRKVDRKFPGPSLIEDPHNWTDEVLGSMVWSASADVRLGLERHGQGGEVVFGGYRRGDGELSPRILQCRMTDVDGEPTAVLWESAPMDATSKFLLPTGMADQFAKLPRDKPFTWSDIIGAGIPRSSAHRLVERAEGVGLLERDRTNKTFRRRA